MPRLHIVRTAFLLALTVPCLLSFGSCKGPLPPLAVPAGENPERWADDMRAFEEQDRTAPAAPDTVVFVGSSSIRLWQTLADDMHPYPVRNRGFGGSRLFDSCYWSETLVDVHDPAAVVVFSGTNDIAGDRPKSATAVRDLFRLLVTRLRHRDAALPIAFVAITPTPARLQHIDIVREANRLIAADCATDDRLFFIDPTAALATDEGAPDPRFFRDDRLHLNADGYAVWTEHVRPVVARALGR